MVRVKMLATMAGPDGTASAGSIVWVTPAAAEVLTAGGFAEAVDVDPAPETAALAAPETATAPAPRKKRAPAKRKVKK